MGQLLKITIFRCIIPLGIIIAAVFGLGAWWQLISYQLPVEKILSQQTSKKTYPEPSLQEMETTAAALRQRALLYETLLEQRNLNAGMVINLRLSDGSPDDICDSLLFSSLRFVALTKLGLDSKAHQAWASIEQSREKGQWLRHPLCRETISRDMILGLMLALSQNPPHALAQLEELQASISTNSGFFSVDKEAISFTTLNMGNLLRQLSAHTLQAYSPLAFSLRWGVSTLEVDSLFLQKGYASHLVALSLWLERQLQPQKISPSETSSRSIFSFFGYFDPFHSQAFLAQLRWQWISRKLLLLDHKNLFFTWLYWETRGLLTSSIKYHLMRTLLSMPQFPPTALPTSCSRKADYLWQRDSQEYLPEVPCTSHTTQYSGVDFLWMAGLLLSK